MINSIVQPQIDYGSQLWLPQEGRNIKNIEKLLGDFKNNNSLSERKELLGEASNTEPELRPKEAEEVSDNIYLEYIHICIINGSDESQRDGRLCEIPHLRGKAPVKTLRNQSFLGPRLFNSMAKSIRNMTKCGLEEFKGEARSVPDRGTNEPKASGLLPGANRLFT